MQKKNHVMITGAGSGLGLGMALRYLRRGWTVSVLDLTVSPASHNLLEVAAREGVSDWQFHLADITNFDLLLTAVQNAVVHFCAPYLAINSAGVVLNKTFAEMQPGNFQRVINTNLNGTHNFAAAVLPTMQAGSRLALVASLAGITVRESRWYLLLVYTSSERKLFLSIFLLHLHSI